MGKYRVWHMLSVVTHFSLHLDLITSPSAAVNGREIYSVTSLSVSIWTDFETWPQQARSLIRNQAAGSVPCEIRICSMGRCCFQSCSWMVYISNGMNRELFQSTPEEIAPLFGFEWIEVTCCHSVIQTSQNLNVLKGTFTVFVIAASSLFKSLSFLEMVLNLGHSHLLTVWVIGDVVTTVGCG